MPLGKQQRLAKAFRLAWTPPPRISVPDWADRYRKLAKEAGSTSGNWSTATVEIARGPMMAVTEPGVHVLTTMVSTQLLKTALLENVFGYFAHLDPCPILLLQPKEEAALQFSKERISPLLRVTPVLRQLVGTSKTRNADETLLFKAFPGGFLALAGAGSPDNLARRPIRVLLADEVDKYPITREGDPIALAEERTATFGVNWLSVRACSPTVEDESRIAKSYADSDQRRASLACPHCGHRMFPDFFKHVHWDKEGDKHLPKTARIACESCGAVWSEGDRLNALKTARWHQARVFEHCGARHSPLDEYEAAWRDGQDAVEKVWDWWESGRHAVYRAKCPDCGAWAVDNEHAGFQASKLFSPWQKDKPSDIATKWIAAKGDPDKEQAWWNTQMGLPHRPHAGKELRMEALLARCELWPNEIPTGVGVATAGIDVQDYRVEIEVVGWGRNEESWSIDYEVIDGEFSDPKTQAALDRYLRKIWRGDNGRAFEVMAACIDSGGHHTQAVYEFCKARIGRRVWAIKGESARNGQRSPVWPTKRPSSRNKATYRPVILGVNAAKDTIRARLLLDAPGSGAFPAGYMHFPADRDMNYFMQLTAERSIVKSVAGSRYRVWEQIPGRANEALDCRVYAYGALCGLLHFGLKLNKRTDAALLAPVAAEPIEIPTASDEQAAGTAPAQVARPATKKSLISRLA
ncbi:phage terminase large subunit family protein [Variovorax sp. N23]|uniref:phage terminase large subunit family protein n=1 Tax=Variovorax sp. N23 TaxID=2980555 RepID=UPI0021C80F95|nr:phage terminase large subunit family protein [Variovorax sp. N23]MCU4119311.1 phage terminase large subunit family protein [Variovorax sp. N23]